MRNRRAAATAVLALVVLAGCGGGDDDSDTPADAPAASSEGSAATPEGTAAAAPESNGGGGGGLGMGPETFAKQLIFALRADSYTVDGSTITMEFTEGSTADGEGQCSIAAATVGGNATVVLAYPDGEFPCE